MTTGNLPVRYEIRNTSTPDSSNVLKQTCCSVISEGGYEDVSGIMFSADVGSNLAANDGTSLTPVLSIRPKLLFNGVTNRAQVILQAFNIIGTGALTNYKLIYNGSLTSAAFQSVDADSLVESDTAASAITGGIAVYSGYIASGTIGGASFTPGSFVYRLPFTLDYAGATADILTLAVQGVGGTTKVVGSLVWKEIKD